MVMISREENSELGGLAHPLRSALYWVMPRHKKM